jgi:siroheme synthase-like protein
VAARKIRSLVDFGALVTVLSPEPGEKVRSLAREYGSVNPEKDGDGKSGAIVILLDSYRIDFLKGQSLVIAATSDDALNRRVALDAAKEGIPVNVADNPGLCSFFFPALVRRGDLVAGISTAGACPRLAARLRERLEISWPRDLGESLDALKEIRRALKNSVDTGEVIKELDAYISAMLDGKAPDRQGKDRRRL